VATESQNLTAADYVLWNVLERRNADHLRDLLLKERLNCDRGIVVHATEELCPSLRGRLRACVYTQGWTFRPNACEAKLSA